jgi:tetratricopeptide (TPR) repeat protein
MSEILINNMLLIKGLKHAVIDQIVERADGNPFFIEEVVRSFIDHGAVVQKDGAFEVTEKIDKMVVPHTINDVLMARIDRLDEKTRELVKIASVIGRSFFYRILKEMTKTIEDIDNRLSHLKDIQLFRERKRMDELEYLFKHALAQEVAYESILQQTRMDLHRSAANSIEKIFKERLHEFYGMLAYHYSKGENLDKAEKYMIKAGEEALSSSASSEAIHYYREALSLYTQKYGDKADPEKLAVLEKNIGLALYNKGEMDEAVKYFDRVLKRWGIKPFQNKVFILMKFLFDLFAIILRLYLTSDKSRKIPTQKDREIFNLSRKKCLALIFVDPMRTVAEAVWDIRRILKYDLSEIENGIGTILGGVGVFTSTGLSFKLCKKFLEYAERSVDKNKLREVFELRVHQDFYSFFSGKYGDLQVYDELLVDENLRIGLFFETVTYLGIHSRIKFYRGEFNDVYPLIEKTSKMYDDYEYKQSKQYQLIIELEQFFKQRMLSDAQKVIEKYEVAFKNDSGTLSINFFGQKAGVLLLINDYDGAEKSFGLAKEMIKKQDGSLPMFTYCYFHSLLLLDIRLLETAILSNNKSNIPRIRKKAGKSSKKLLKNIKICSVGKLEGFRLIGSYYWLIDNQNKAVKWWKRAIEETERFGARPDLARTYMEIGKRFLEEKSKYKELNGISAEEYLEKARKMFQEMDLQWDLDELDKISVLG